MTGSDNRIDGNNLLENDTGISSPTGGNLIVRNSASGNSVLNYSFPSSNTYHSPFTGPGTFSAADPWVNFEY